MPDAEAVSFNGILHPVYRIRILLIDDHVLFREGLVRLLATEPDFELVAQCSTNAEGLSVLKRHPVDVILLDFDLGDDTARTLVDALHHAESLSKVLIVTAGVSPLDTAFLRDEGVSGIFQKHGSPATLLDAIRVAASGGRWIDRQSEASEEFTFAPNAAKEPLTVREAQVLHCVFEGLINKQIATRIGVSESSVKSTLQQLFDKTGVRTRSQLVRFALERSLIKDA